MQRVAESQVEVQQAHLPCRSRQPGAQGAQARQQACAPHDIHFDGQLAQPLRRQEQAAPAAAHQRRSCGGATQVEKLPQRQRGGSWRQHTQPRSGKRRRPHLLWPKLWKMCSSSSSGSAWMLMAASAVSLVRAAGVQGSSSDRQGQQVGKEQWETGLECTWCPMPANAEAPQRRRLTSSSTHPSACPAQVAPVQLQRADHCLLQ